MGVHNDISKHVEGQNQKITYFLQLDELREQLIQEALASCKEGKNFTTDRINEVTKEMNMLTMKGELPKRTLVTVEMIREYVSRSN